MVAKGEGKQGRDGNLGLTDAYGIYREWINRKVLLYSAGNYIYILLQTIMEKNANKNR